MFGKHKGFDVHRINRRKAQKDNFGNHLSAVVPCEKLLEEVFQAISGNGRVYTFTHKGKEVYCVIFSREESTEKKPILRMTAMYALQSVQDLIPEFQKTILVELQEAVAFEIDGIKEVIWDDVTIVPGEREKNNRGWIAGIAMGVAFTVVYGLLFHNYGVGMCFGVSQCMIWGAVFSRSKMNAKVIKEGENAAD